MPNWVRVVISARKFLDLVFCMCCHENLFLETHLIPWKAELPKPVTLSLLDLNLDPHVKTFEFLKMSWLNMSGCLYMSEGEMTEDNKQQHVVEATIKKKKKYYTQLVCEDCLLVESTQRHSLHTIVSVRLSSTQFDSVRLSLRAFPGRNLRRNFSRQHQLYKRLLVYRTSGIVCQRQQVSVPIESWRNTSIQVFQ